MSSPLVQAQKRIHYRLVQRLVQATASTFTATLNPMSFPFDGLCRVEVRAIGSVGTATKLVAINLDVSQPYSQSNFSSGDVRWNTTRTLALHYLENGTKLDTRSSPQFAEVVLRPSETITFTVTDAEADNYTAYSTWTSIVLDIVIRKVDL